MGRDTAYEIVIDIQYCEYTVHCTEKEKEYGSFPLKIWLQIHNQSISFSHEFVNSDATIAVTDRLQPRIPVQTTSSRMNMVRNMTMNRINNQRIVLLADFRINT